MYGTGDQDGNKWSLLYHKSPENTNICSKQLEREAFIPVLAYAIEERIGDCMMLAHRMATRIDRGGAVVSVFR